MPLLVDGDLAVWDTLAIAEYVAEQFSSTPLWPHDKAARARARSVCAEMHAGFTALRSNCPMNIEADAGSHRRPDLARQTGCARRCGPPGRHVGRPAGPARRPPAVRPVLSVADAYFAPVCTRLKTYGLPLPPKAAAYVARVLALPGVQAWMNDARWQRKTFWTLKSPTA